MSIGSKIILKTVCSGPDALASKRLSELDHLMNTNLALANFKLKQFSDCILYCNKALLRRKTLRQEILEKTLYRKAMSELEIGNLENSVQTCKDLLGCFPENAAGAQLLQRLERELALESKAQRATYAKLFQKLEFSVNS